jgi:hypothetical protein
MHFHLPKPMHGWREFLGEVGIIVLGVLLALGFEQIVDAVHWRFEVGELRDAMRVELAADRARVEQNLQQDHCALARLRAIEQWASTSSRKSRIPSPDGPVLWNYHSTSWDLAKASPATTHFSLSERLAYASAYDSVTSEQRYLTTEQENWGELGASLVSANQPQSRAMIQREVALARNHLRSRESNSMFFLQKLDSLGIRADPRSVPFSVNSARLCAPFASQTT